MRPARCRRRSLRPGCRPPSWLDLLDHYARDPMGGGEGLSDYAKLIWCAIRQVPGFHGALAWLDGEAVAGA